MSNQNLKTIKQECLDDIRNVLSHYQEQLSRIDIRLWRYAEDVVRTDVDVHNLDEILGLRKFLRLITTYELDEEHCRMVIGDAEGLKIDGIYGYQHYPMTPSQVFILCSIFGIKSWKSTESPEGSRVMLQSEEVRNGIIFDRRRLVRQYVMMLPRKYAKTFLGAFAAFEEMMRGERDAEIYIVANSQEQSKLLYKQLRQMLEQKDPAHKWFRFTATEINWKPQSGRSAKIQALTAGSKSKDGLKASLCCADEFGGAQRIKEKCDMEGLINVVEGSMGTRREPLTIHTSTAGLGNETPYEQLISQVHEILLKEMDIPLDLQPHTTDNDWQGAIIFRPDEWERDDVSLQDERVMRKCNPHIGITIQSDYYSGEWKKAAVQGELKKKEVITKLYNIFQTDKLTDWITADEIRPLQIDRKIEDCKATDGWIVLTGLDFTNVGDDLQAATYLAVRAKEDGTREFFADLDAWMSEEEFNKSPIRSLLEQYRDKGHLHVVPGAVLSPQLPVDRIVSLRHQYGVNMMGWGYDPARANEPINLLKDWLVSVIGVNPQHVSSYIMPVKQTYFNYNPLVDEMSYCIKAPSPMIRFSKNPLWPWQFQNCVLAESVDGMENKKPVKKTQTAKVDNIQSLLNALYVYDSMNSKVLR